MWRRVVRATLEVLPQVVFTQRLRQLIADVTQLRFQSDADAWDERERSVLLANRDAVGQVAGETKID
jgi:hypothetical protein